MKTIKYLLYAVTILSCAATQVRGMEIVTDVVDPFESASAPYFALQAEQVSFVGTHKLAVVTDCGNRREVKFGISDDGVMIINNDFCGVKGVAGILIYVKETLGDECISMIKKLIIDIDPDVLGSGLPKDYPLPPEIRFFTSLKELDLHGSRITQLPDEIGLLTELEKLYFRDCSLTELPRTIGNCKKLKFLDLYCNKLSSLPEEIRDLPDLEVINLLGNPMMKDRYDIIFTELPLLLQELIKKNIAILGFEKQTKELVENNPGKYIFKFFHDFFCFL